MKMKIIFGVVMIFLIALIAIGTLLGRSAMDQKIIGTSARNEQAVPKEDLKQEVRSESNQPSFEDSDTDGWKTYRNEKYGYQIKYPLNWAIKECSSEYAVFDTSAQSLKSVCSCKEGPCYPGLAIIEEGKKEQTQSLLEALMKDGFQSDIIYVSGQRATRLRNKNSSSVYIFIERDDYIIRIIYQSFEEDTGNEKLFNRMIDSLILE